MTTMYGQLCAHLARILVDHEGAIVDHVYVLIDDCVYDLTVGTDTFTPVEDWQP